MSTDPKVHERVIIRLDDTQEMYAREDAGVETKTIGSTFYRGEQANFNPYKADRQLPDFCEKYVLNGWLPPQPFLDRQTRITAFGSCFAQNISEHLIRLGFSTAMQEEPDIYISTMGEGLVNVHALLGQLEWALENKPQPDNLWHGYKAEQFTMDEEIRQKTAAIFRATDFFILTFGLSEIWYDEVTGGTLWRAVPMALYDPARHKFRVCSFAETKAAMEKIYALIREHVPQAKVLMTLSPIPLAATFRPVSCITANSVSKSILRAALDEFMRGREADVNARLFYFPTYEMMGELFADPYGDDARHPHPFIIPALMKLFEAFYCVGGIDKKLAEREILIARTICERLIAARQTH